MLEGYSVGAAPDGVKGLDELDRQPYDLVLLDLALPGENGIDLLPRILDRHPQLPIIMITAYGTVTNVVDAIRAGARNFVQKPWENEKLLADIRAAIAQHRTEEENVQLKRALKQRYTFENIVGKSEPMLRILDLVAQVAPSRFTVLIQGETGTGKDVIAKAIHANSPRRDKPFVPINTGALPTELLESQLFGHVKGAFTSAHAAQKGLFEIANGGTLFLDEIGTMGLETQAKILRVLQDRRFRPLGSVQEVQVDVRILAATNSNLRQGVREGRFREDLYYRLNVVTIDLPPLRARREDIPLLATHFLEHFSEENQLETRRLAPEVMRAMMDYDWPGNVRELEHVIARGVALSPTPVIPLEVLPGELTGPLLLRFPAGARCQCVALRHSRRYRAPHHHGQARALELESDRGGGAVPHPAIDSESEDQAAEHRNTQEAKRIAALPIVAVFSVWCDRAVVPADHFSSPKRSRFRTPLQRNTSR